MNLTKPQRDAALNAARVLMAGNPNNAADRLAYRTARFRLAAMLPVDADVREIVSAAVRWDMADHLAATLVGDPLLEKHGRKAA